MEASAALGPEGFQSALPSSHPHLCSSHPGIDGSELFAYS